MNMYRQPKKQTGISKKQLKTKNTCEHYSVDGFDYFRIRM